MNSITASEFIPTLSLQDYDQTLVALRAVEHNYSNVDVLHSKLLQAAHFSANEAIRADIDYSKKDEILGQAKELEAFAQSVQGVSSVNIYELFDAEEHEILAKADALLTDRSVAFPEFNSLDIRFIVRSLTKCARYDSAPEDKLAARKLVDEITVSTRSPKMRDAAGLLLLSIRNYKDLPIERPHQEGEFTSARTT